MLKLLTLCIIVAAIIFLIVAIKNVYDIKYSINTIKNKKSYRFIVFNIFIASVFVVSYMIYGIFIYSDDPVDYIKYQEHSLFSSFLFLCSSIFIYIASIVTKKMGALLYTIDKLRKEDSLTKIYNRGYIEKIIENEYERCLRYKKMACLIMIDINNFKPLNDKYGHLVGDKILIDLTSMLQEICRKSDYVGRYGGDEFIIVLPETSLTAGQEMYDRIEQEINNRILYVNGEEINYKIALGIASIDTSLDKDMYTYKKWMQEVDSDLYESKRKLKDVSKAL